MNLTSRLATIQDRMARAAERSGREASAITMIAVSKTVDPTAVKAALDLGVRDFGENRAQELVSKYRQLADLPLRWHFIGHLQSNKVGHVVPIASMIHSVDSTRLAEKIADLGSPDRPTDILLQVNVSGEASKFGIDPLDLPGQVAAIRHKANLRLCGLMTLGPLTEDPGEIRTAFRKLRVESTRLREILPGATILSMGMSGDFEIAIEEGATHIRIGTALFGDSS